MQIYPITGDIWLRLQVGIASNDSVIQNALKRRNGPESRRFTTAIPAQFARDIPDILLTLPPLSTSSSTSLPVPLRIDLAHYAVSSTRRAAPANSTGRSRRCWSNNRRRRRRPCNYRRSRPYLHRYLAAIVLLLAEIVIAHVITCAMLRGSAVLHLELCTLNALTSGLHR